jgi:hypothetical protein
MGAELLELMLEMAVAMRGWFLLCFEAAVCENPFSRATGALTIPLADAG